MTRVLVTNDDGVTSPGIRALAEVAIDLGLEVTVAAPAWNSSGASASLTGVSEDGRLVFEEQPVDGLRAARVIGVHAAPALIVRVGVRGGFGPEPHLVLSGINDGQNVGHAVLHSGTVGAALTAATHGCRAVAVSLAGRHHSGPTPPHPPPRGGAAPPDTTTRPRPWPGGSSSGRSTPRRRWWST